VTYNSCSAIRWNDGISFPVESGHPCIGCSEPDYFDKESFYAHETTVLPPSWGLGIQATTDRVGLAALGVAGAAIAVHIAASAVARARSKEVNKDMGVDE
jgi:hydrogenase small subunit